jgi:hypothetical protein
LTDYKKALIDLSARIEAAIAPGLVWLTASGEGLASDLHWGPSLRPSLQVCQEKLLLEHKKLKELKSSVEVFLTVPGLFEVAVLYNRLFDGETQTSDVQRIEELTHEIKMNLEHNEKEAIKQFLEVVELFRELHYRQEVLVSADEFASGSASDLEISVMAEGDLDWLSEVKATVKQKIGLLTSKKFIKRFLRGIQLREQLIRDLKAFRLSVVF